MNRDRPGSRKDIRTPSKEIDMFGKDILKDLFGVKLPGPPSGKPRPPFPGGKPTPPGPGSSSWPDLSKLGKKPGRK